jgi:hypothetical protein
MRNGISSTKDISHHSHCHQCSQHLISLPQTTLPVSPPPSRSESHFVRPRDVLVNSVASVAADSRQPAITDLNSAVTNSDPDTFGPAISREHDSGMELSYGIEIGPEVDAYASSSSHLFSSNLQPLYITSSQEIITCSSKENNAMPVGPLSTKTKMVGPRGLPVTLGHLSSCTGLFQLLDATFLVAAIFSSSFSLKDSVYQYIFRVDNFSCWRRVQWDLVFATNI